MIETRRSLVVVGLVALAARLAVALWGAGRVPPTADGAFYHVVAQRIAAGHGYTWLWPDGAVTFAAHYPVGYPAFLGALYRLFGAHPAVAMVASALLGAAASVAAAALTAELLFALDLGTPRVRSRSVLFAGLSTALSPTLVLYTPALMTELPVGALITFGGWLALFARRAERRAKSAVLVGLLGVLVGLATLLRPQNILLAPLLGWLAARGRVPVRLGSAVVVSMLALGVTAPWLARNCEKMGACTFVSANGGWNLLIGTFPEGRGAWVPIEGERVPPECREVFEEALKDVCFKRAGVARIRSAPIAWLSLAPQKLEVTFDHTGAAAEHLRASGALTSDTERLAVGALEIGAQRVSFLVALLGAFAAFRRAAPVALGQARADLAGRLLVMVGAAGFAGLGATFGWLAVLLLLVPLAAARLARAELPVGLGLFLGGLLATGLVHAVFFGAGRYFVPVLFWLTPLVGWGFVEVLGFFDRRRAARG